MRRGGEEGARLCTGGGRAGDLYDRGSFYEPAVFADVTPEMAIAQRGDLRAGRLDPAVRRRGRSGPARERLDLRPLRLALDARRRPGAARGARGRDRRDLGQLELGASTSEMPFGGVKRSGMGRELGTAALEHYSEWKSVFVAAD